MEAAVLVVGLVFGSLSLGAAIIVFIRHRFFGLGGSMLSVVGLILIGMSVWKSVDIQAGGQVRVRLEKAEKEIQKAEAEIKNLNNFKTTLVTQAKLKELDIYKGPLDGLSRPQFKSAVTKFQTLKGINPTGDIDKQTFAIILKDQQKFDRNLGSGAIK